MRDRFTDDFWPECFLKIFYRSSTTPGVHADTSVSPKLSEWKTYKKCPLYPIKLEREKFRRSLTDINFLELLLFFHSFQLEMKFCFSSQNWLANYT